MMYSIIGTYRGNAEEIDSAPTMQDAIILMREYKMAFGSEWNISIKRNKQ
jgi:hypothetical protein